MLLFNLPLIQQVIVCLLLSANVCVFVCAAVRIKTLSRICIRVLRIMNILEQLTCQHAKTEAKTRC